MKYSQIFAKTIFLLALPLLGNAEATCSDKVAKLELKRTQAVSIGGMWGYFEKNFNLKKISIEAIQLDSRINKIFFLLNHLCETRNGIPLTPLARYISKNLSNKGEDKFKNELLILGKTPEQIKEWFEFCRYSENHASRTLLNSEIQIAIDQSTPFIMRYAQLTRATPNENLLRESFQKMKNLIIDIDKLLSRQFYLSQALEETSHVLYWDISEGELG